MSSLIFELGAGFAETGTGVVINLADVSHIETSNGLTYIITRNSRWDDENDVWDNVAILKGNDALRFTDRLCIYWTAAERQRVGTLIVRVQHDYEGQGWSEWAITVEGAQWAKRLGVTVEEAIQMKMIDAREIK